MDLSVIIPAYNEEKKIGFTLEEISGFLDPKGVDYEVLVVDDGSRDGTCYIAQNSPPAKKDKLKIIRNERNMGKGYSVKRGVEEAAGDYILFSDADLSTPIREFEKMRASVDKGSDIAIASRAASTSTITVRQPFYRETMGKCFNLIIRFILGERFGDTQCGFKLFKKDAAKLLFNKLTVNGFAFDAELLFLARRNGLKIEEVGVEWANSRESKVRPLVSSLQMLFDVFRIRFARR